MEYALLLALLVAGGLAAYLVVGTGLDQTFRRIGRDASSRPDGDTSSSPDDAADHASKQATDSKLEQAAEAPANWFVLVLFGTVVWIGVVTIGIAFWQYLRRQAHASLAREAVKKEATVSLSAGAKERLFEKRQQIRRLFEREAARSSAFSTQVRHLMSHQLKTIGPDAPASEATAIMHKQKIRHLLVCRGDGPLVGIISDRDSAERVGETVRDIMTADPITVSPEMDAGPVITLMINRSISCVPVIEQGTVCGVLTTTDLLLTLQCTLQIIEA